MVEARVELAGNGVRRLRLLDLLRLIAALAVVLFHYTARLNDAWGDAAPSEVWAPLSSVTAYGALGIQLFFLVSGFVVLMSAWHADVPKFVASRVSRLYPAYWFGVLATAAFLFFDRSITIGGSWEGLGVSGVLVNLTMMQSAFGVPHVDGVYWTLWVELKFYVLLGLLVALGVTRRRLLLLCTAWPVGAALFSGLQQPFVDELLMPDHAPFFAAGMLLFLIYREGWSLVTALALGLNWIVMMRFAFVDGIHLVSDNTLVGSSPYLVAAAYTGFLVVIALVTQTRLSAVNAAWLTVAGALTYPLYLLHEVIGWWLIGRLHPALPAPIVLVLVIGLMLAAAYAVHRFIERPLGPLLRRRLEAGLRAPGTVRVPSRPGAQPARARGENLRRDGWESAGAAGS